MAAQHATGLSWRSTLLSLVGAVGLTVSGMLVAAQMSKAIGEPASTSFDTAGSRVGLALAATGLVMLLATLATIPQRLRPVGTLLVGLATLAAAGLLVSTPTVHAATHAYPVAHDISCNETALQHAVLPWPEWDLPASDAMRECRTQSRIRLTVALGGATLVWAMVLVRLRRSDTPRTP